MAMFHSYLSHSARVLPLIGLQIQQDPGVVMTLQAAASVNRKVQTHRIQTRRGCPHQNTTAIGWAKDRFSSSPHIFLVNLGAYRGLLHCSLLDPLARDWTWWLWNQHQSTYWRFLKWGYPQKSSIYRLSFRKINHHKSSILGSPHFRNSGMRLCSFLWTHDQGHSREPDPLEIKKTRSNHKGY